MDTRIGNLPDEERFALETIGPLKMSSATAGWKRPVSRARTLSCRSAAGLPRNQECEEVECG